MGIFDFFKKKKVVKKETTQEPKTPKQEKHKPLVMNIRTNIRFDEGFTPNKPGPATADDLEWLKELLKNEQSET